MFILVKSQDRCVHSIKIQLWNLKNLTHVVSGLSNRDSSKIWTDLRQTYQSSRIQVIKHVPQSCNPMWTKTLKMEFSRSFFLGQSWMTKLKMHIQDNSNSKQPIANSKVIDQDNGVEHEKHFSHALAIS